VHVARLSTSPAIGPVGFVRRVGRRALRMDRLSGRAEFDEPPCGRHVGAAPKRNLGHLCAPSNRQTAASIRAAIEEPPVQVSRAWPQCADVCDMRQLQRYRQRLILGPDPRSGASGSEQKGILAPDDSVSAVARGRGGIRSRADPYHRQGSGVLFVWRSLSPGRCSPAVRARLRTG